MTTTTQADWQPVPPPEHIALRFAVDDNRARGVPMLDRRWYYTIELEPGVWTKGADLNNVHLTRRLLANIDVKGLDCLDLGAMECMIPILLSRRGAGRITAYDRLSMHERVALLKSKLGVSFDYIHGITLEQLRTEALRSRVFDLVVCSGLLYHMIDPLAGLVTARGFVRNGGLIVLETLAVASTGVSLEFNAEARLVPGDNYFLPSVGWLNYALRMVRLRPLDAVYLRSGGAEGAPPLCRVAIVCQAQESVPAHGSEDWIRRPQTLRDLREYMDWDAVCAGSRPALPYEPVTKLPVMCHGGVDVTAVLATPETRPAQKSDVRLPLAATT